MADPTDQQVSAIISAFGGIRPMAAKLGAPVSTVQGWKQRNTIPAARIAEIREIAREKDVILPELTDPKFGMPASATEAGQNPAPASVSRREDGFDPSVADDSGSGGGGRATGIALLALFVAIGTAAWLSWSTAGPVADVGVNMRISTLEDEIAQLSDSLGNLGKIERDAMAEQIESLRSDFNKSELPNIEGLVTPLREKITSLLEQSRSKSVETSSAIDPFLEQRLAALEASGLHTAQRADVDMRNMSEDIVKFNSRISELETGATEIAARLAAVTQNDTRQYTTATDAIALTLSVLHLRRAVVRGESFDMVLGVIDDLFRADEALVPLLTRLKTHASTGVPTRDDLTFAFPDAAAAIFDNETREAPDDIVDQILDRARRFVRVRRVGTDVPADSIDGQVTRAELRLRAGDVAGAVMVLQALSGSSRIAAEPWLTKATAHIDVVRALEFIELLALERLRAAGSQ